jgi:hypothetical protein
MYSGAGVDSSNAFAVLKINSETNLGDARHADDLTSNCYICGYD